MSPLAIVAWAFACRAYWAGCPAMVGVFGLACGPAICDRLILVGDNGDRPTFSHDHPKRLTPDHRDGESTRRPT
jgi:hypothetical protein